jgi:hypothetical protein
LIGLSNCSFTGRNDMLDVVGDTKCSLGLVCGDGESRSEVRGEVDRSVVLWTPPDAMLEPLERGVLCMLPELFRVPDNVRLDLPDSVQLV